MNPEAIDRLMVDHFLDAHESAPLQIILDLDATDDPTHGHQEGRFFHGYYDCYCYLPLYIFCGNSGFVVGDREREALLKLPQRWKKQYAALLFPTLLGKVQDNFSTAPITPTAKLTESFWEGAFGSHARPSTL